MVTGLSINIKQNSQSVTNNTSNVTIECSITWNGGSYNALGTAKATMVVNGTTYTLSGSDANFNEGRVSSGTEVFWTKTLTIQHTSDGKGAVSVSLTYDTKTDGAPFSASASKTLTTIPRASTIGASDANVGAVSTISVARKSTAYTHTIQYAFGSLSGFLKADGSLSTSAVKLTATSIPFTIPADFYAQIPNAASGACKLTCKTYSGSTQIGDAQTATFTVTAKKSTCKPSVSGTVVDSNEATLALTGDSSKLVRYMSDALCTITAAAKNSATLVSKTIGGVSVTGDTRTITGIDAASVVFGATDSRGYSNSATVPVSLIPYVLLTGVLTAGRTDPTSGKATLSVKGNYYNGSFGTQENSLTVRYKVGSGDYVSIEPVLDGNAYTATASLTGLDYQSSHKITVQITDALETVTKTVTIGKGIPVFDWGEEDFTFHVPVAVPDPVNDTDAVNKAYAVNRAGDTMTGALRVPKKLILTGDTSYFPRVQFVDSSLTTPEVKGEVLCDTGNQRVYFRNYTSDHKYYENFRLPVPGENREDNGQYNILTNRDLVTIAQGGTGGATAAAARSNLGTTAVAIQSGSVEGNSSKTFTFSNSVKAVLVTAILNSYCATGLWTSGNSGKTNRFYHMGADGETWDTTVTISGKTVTVTRAGATTLTYIVIAITA